MELAIRTAMTQLGASLLGRLLAADTGHRGPRIDCRAGHCTGFVGYRSKTIQTVLGSVELRRAYYHCRVCRRGVVPRDDELGVTGVSLSPGLRRITARAAAAVPFATAADLLAELAGIQLPAKRIERSAEADGAATARRLAAESTAIVRPSVSMLPPVPMPDKLYVAVDGTGVPVVAAAVADRAGKAPDGRARTREVKLAALFTQTTVDEKGRRSETRTRPATWAASPPPPSSPPWCTPRPAAAAPTTSANSSSSATARLDLEPGHHNPAGGHPDR